MPDLGRRVATRESCDLGSLASEEEKCFFLTAAGRDCLAGEPLFAPPEVRSKGLHDDERRRQDFRTFARGESACLDSGADQFTTPVRFLYCGQ